MHFNKLTTGFIRRSPCGDFIFGSYSRVCALAVLACAFTGISAADTIYNITFTPGSSVPDAQVPTGSFHYDPVLGFSNFVVSFDGINFDATSSANNNSYPLFMPNTASSQAFATMSQSLSCDLTLDPGCAITGYGYNIGVDGRSVESSLVFQVFFTDPYNPPGSGAWSAPLNVDISSTPGDITGSYQQSGTFSITTASATPEPASLSLMFGGLALLGWKVSRRRKTLRF